jgi:hypothetical protein
MLRQKLHSANMVDQLTTPLRLCQPTAASIPKRGQSLTVKCRREMSRTAAASCMKELSRKSTNTTRRKEKNILQYVKNNAEQLALGDRIVGQSENNATATAATIRAVKSLPLVADGGNSEVSGSQVLQECVLHPATPLSSTPPYGGGVRLSPGVCQGRKSLLANGRSNETDRSR